MHTTAWHKQRFDILVMLVGICVCAGTSAAEPLLQNKLCTPDGILDKEKFVSYLLDEYPLSIKVFDAQEAGTNPGDRRGSVARLIAANEPCKDKCGRNDQGNLDSIQAYVKAVLHGRYAPDLIPTDGQVSVAAFLMSANAEHAVNCPADAKQELTRVSGKPEPKKSASLWRLRGDPSQLGIGREDKKKFAGTDPATISVAHDIAAGQKTNNVVGFLGYAIDLDGGARTIIPYVGGVKNTVRVNDVVNSSKSSDTVSVGSLFDFIGDSGGFAYELTARPDYLVDHIDGSHLFSLNFEYVPVRDHWWLNGYGDIPGGAAKFILTIDSTNGTYSHRSTSATGDQQQNYSRLGANAGFAVSLDGVSGLEFKTVYTALAALRGKTSVDYLQSSLSYSLDPNGYTGMALKYSRGRRPDTLKDEKQWGVSLTVRY